MHQRARVAGQHPMVVYGFKHFCSWLGLCPGTKISGGKVLSSRTRRSVNRARQALKMAAMSLSRNGSALGALYRRMCARMDKPRANTATAHKPARMVYFMLTRGEDFVDQGSSTMKSSSASAVWPPSSVALPPSASSSPRRKYLPDPQRTLVSHEPGFMRLWLGSKPTSSEPGSLRDFPPFKSPETRGSLGLRADDRQLGRGLLPVCLKRLVP